MDFTGPEAYGSLQKKASADKKYIVATLPQGATVYRADAEGKKEPSEGVPNFFSDKQSIRPYMRGESEAKVVSSYTANRDLTLLVLNYNNIRTIAKESDDSIKAFITEIYLGQGVDSETNELLTFLKPTAPLEQGNPRNYANRKFAEIVCSKGYDGWVAFPNTLKQRNLSPIYRGDLQHFLDDQQQGRVQYVINPYYPEIVVCKWKETMVYKGGKRKMTRRYCKNTSCKKMGFTQKASCRPYKNCYKNKK